MKRQWIRSGVVGQGLMSLYLLVFFCLLMFFCLSFCLDGVEVGVGMTGIEDFVAVHDRDEVLGVGEVDDVVGIAGQHDDRLDFIARHFIFDDVVGALLSHLYQPVAFDDDKLFPLGVVPMLSFRDTGLGNIDAYLTATGRMDQFGERAAVIDVHLQVKHGFVLGQIAQIGRQQPLCKAIGRYLGNHQRPGHGGKSMQHIDNLTESGPESCRDIAVSPTLALPARDGSRGLAVERAVMFATLQGKDHLLDEVVDIEQLEFDRRIVDLNGQSVGDVVAERGDGRVVVGPAPFAKEVGKAVDQDLRARGGGIAEKELFAGLLALAVGMARVSAYQRRLDGAAEHHRAGVAVLSERVKQRRGESEVPPLEILGIFGPVHSGEVEHKVGLAAVPVELLRRRVDVIFKHLVDGDRIVARFAVPNVI